TANWHRRLDTGRVPPPFGILRNQRDHISISLSDGSERLQLNEKFAVAPFVRTRDRTVEDLCELKFCQPTVRRFQGDENSALERQQLDAFFSQLPNEFERCSYRPDCRYS